MRLRFVFANTGCLLLSLFMLIGCNGQQGKGGKTKPEYPFDSANAAKYIIPIEKAREYQRSFVRSKAELKRQLKDTAYLDKNFNLPNAESFSKDALLLLLNQKEAVAIRFYYGRDEKGAIRLVLLPIRKDGTVIYNKLSGEGKPKRDSTDKNAPATAPPAVQAEAVETGQTCPPCILD